MNNEAILWTAALILILLAIILLFRQLRSKKKEEAEKAAGKASAAPSSTGTTDKSGEKSAGTVVSGSPIKENAAAEKEATGKKASGLLYIPPEMTVSDSRPAGDRESRAGEGTVHPAEAGTEIRDHFGGHESKSEPASVSASDAGSEYSPGDSSSTANEDHEVPAEAERGVVRIYLYRADNEKWVCPYCEMENPRWTGICQVCGELRPRA